MNTLHGMALAALLAGAPALAGGPAMANPAHHGDGTAQFAQAQGQQAQGQQAGEGAPTTTGRQPMMGGQQMGGQGSGGMMMDPQMMMRMMQMHGMSPGMMGLGPCGMMAGGDKDLSAEQVKDILEGQIAWIGNERLKVGAVEQKDENTYVAEIVTIDDSLVQKLAIDRKTGAMRPAD
jgi:hypothetical protein